MKEPSTQDMLVNDVQVDLDNLINSLRKCDDNGISIAEVTFDYEQAETISASITLICNGPMAFGKPRTRKTIVYSLESYQFDRKKEKDGRENS